MHFISRSGEAVAVNRQWHLRHLPAGTPITGLETVCRNNGYEVMMFDDFEAARAWAEA